MFHKVQTQRYTEYSTHGSTDFKFSISQSDLHVVTLITGRDKFHHTSSDFSLDVQDADVWTTKLWVLLV